MDARRGKGPAPHKLSPPKLSRAAAIARSSARRYPRELIQSFLRTSRGPARAEIASDPFVDPALDAPLAASWLGHATVLVRIAGLWVLTDPVFSRRIGVQIGPMTLGVERLKEPAVPPERLPPIDLVLVSHAHFDHLDKPSLRRLARPTTAVITAGRTGRLIPPGFGELRELRWDRSTTIGPLTVHAIKPSHWGARTAWDRHREYNAYVIEARGHRVLYAGDTAETNAFEHLRGRGGVDLTVFGIGAYDPWIEAHASPEQVWDMHRSAGGRFLLPIHHSTFRLSNEPRHEPLHRLMRAAGRERARVIGQQAGKLWIPPKANPRAGGG